MKRGLQGLGVLALAGLGIVHLYLYLGGHLPGNGVGYRQIQTIGPLFLLTFIVSWALASAMVIWPNPLVAVAASLFSLATLGAYLLTLLLPMGLFLFTEPGVSYSGGISIAAEVAAAAALLAWATLAWRDGGWKIKALVSRA